MYSIAEILIQLLCLVIVVKSTSDINYLKQYFPFFYYKVINLIYKNNQLVLTNEDINEKQKNVELIEEEKFENKYLEKFKKFPNEFMFDDIELNKEKEFSEKLKIQFEKDKGESIQEIQNELFKIEKIINNGGFREKLDNENDTYTASINSNGINLLLNYFDMIELYEDDPEEVVFEELYEELLEKKEKLLKKMLEQESMTMTEDEARTKARDMIINKKLDTYINNYILEYTPLGNIYMRYNNDKKSFEYFSNNSIPYRYLEPVGRKYVITYSCKPIFIDIEEELKKSEQKYDEKKKEDEMKKEDKKNINPKKVLVKLKEYNRDTKEQKLRPMKNRSDKNAILPSQIQSNLHDVNKSSEKQLLKEKANRYTWEGRLTNFCPLKKIDKKILNKKLNMTYAEFKKLQEQQQNKK
jgi:hypothetical protein